MTLASSQISKVRLREAKEHDLDRTLEWQREPGARQYFREPNPPTRREHENWFRYRLSRPDPALWIIEFEDRPVGTVRLDSHGSPGKEHYEVSLLIASLYRGKGIGAQALSQLRSARPDDDLVATISPENKASIATFARAGFRQTAATRYAASRLSGDKTDASGRPHERGNN